MDTSSSATQTGGLSEKDIDQLAKVLSKQIDKRAFAEKYAPVKEVLKLVGAGVFLAASIAIPNLPVALKPFLKHDDEYEAWKRFNIPYLKRTIERLEKQKLVEIADEHGMQVIKITSQGRQKILKIALDNLAVEKPAVWDRKWRIVSFDLPEKQKRLRKILVEYLKAWGFYPLHKSVYLHAYPCLDQIEYLRQYMGINEYVRIFTVIGIENDAQFKEFFAV